MNTIMPRISTLDKFISIDQQLSNQERIMERINTKLNALIEKKEQAKVCKPKQ